MSGEQGFQPQHVLGGWRTWWGRYLSHAWLNEYGLRVVNSKDNFEWTFEWGKMRSLEFGDASRATLTRVATVGLAGLGIRKTQVRLSFVYEDEGQTWPVHMTLQYAAEADVAAALYALVEHNEEINRLLGVGDVARPSPRALTDRLRELQSLVDEGFISEAEYNEKRASILEAL
jgi:hypothetical protein